MPFGFSSSVAPREARANAVYRRFVDVQRQLKDARNRVASHIVFGRAEAAGEHHHVRPFQRAAELFGELIDVVADNDLRTHVDADGVELFGDDERVGVEA